ncbi:MAG: IS701 family transposase [Planctomycetes bacterium]|nr:IS701 family transposase [Planctomycetota bacterium]
MTADQIRSLQPELAALLETFRPYLRRASNFGHLVAYVLGLMADLKRKSIEPIALAAGAAVRTLQEFLSFLEWDHEGANDHLHRVVMDRHGCARAIGVIDASGHAKQGRMTPGVARQWCGEKGKVDNCVVGQHLLYSDNHPSNPFNCALASDLFVPENWAKDRDRCRKAHIPDEVTYRPKWRIALDQLKRSMANGVRFWFTVFDEDYGKVPQFWFGLDAMGQQAIGEVPRNFRVFAKRPACRSQQKAHRPKRVDNLCRFSPLFREPPWQRVTVRHATRGPIVWEVKMARVHMVVARPRPSRPTDRRYALIVARNVDTGEIKYFISNAAASVPLCDLLTAAFARWQIELWFERAKQEAGFGAFEVRTYRSLLRHWFCSRLAMYFLAAQTQRLRGGKSADHAGASGRSGQRSGVDPLDAYVALAG